MANNTKVRDDDRRGAKPGNPTMPQEHGGAIGQQPHEPTEELRHQVETMVGLGMVQADIGKVLRVSTDTLVRHYRDELDRGKLLAGMNLRQRAYDMAMGKKLLNPDGTVNDKLTDVQRAAVERASVPMTIFLLKTQHGFKETSRHELANTNDGPQTAENPADAVRARLRAITEKAEPVEPPATDEAG